MDETINKGRMYRVAADAVTYGRTVAGVMIAANILSGDRILNRNYEHRSMRLAGSVALLGALDKADGILARKAEENGVPITKEDKEKDPRWDKVFNRCMMGSVAVRELVSGVRKRDPNRMLFAGIVGLNLIATEKRDEKMIESRASAVEGADTSAISINKYKTGIQNLSHSLATSEIVDSGSGQLITGVAYSASTIMGLIGLHEADKVHKNSVCNDTASVYKQ